MSEGPEGGAAKTFTQSEVDAMIAGLKENSRDLLGEKKGLQQRLKDFDGIDPAQAREVLAMFQSNEEMQLIKAGKIDQVFESRTEKLRAAHEKSMQALTGEIDAAKARSTKFSTRVLDDALRAAAMEAGIHRHAMDDALLSGRTVFQLDDDGNAIQRNEEGKPVLGKDGKTPFGPKEWLAGIADTKPHWFPADSSGAPSNGKPGGDVRQKTMKVAQFLQLSPQEQSAISLAKVIRIVD